MQGQQHDVRKKDGQRQAKDQRRRAAPNTSATATVVIRMPTPPFSSTAARGNDIWPAITAVIPSRDARLNRFDPKTTPTATSFWPDIIDTTAAEISGESAPSAVMNPKSCSGMFNRGPNRPKARDRNTLPPITNVRLPRKTGME